MAFRKYFETKYFFVVPILFFFFMLTEGAPLNNGSYARAARENVNANKGNSEDMFIIHIVICHQPTWFITLRLC